jgi:hypothetical protein
LYLPYGGQRKALCVLQMLKLSFLGYKTSFKAWYTHRGLVPALKNEDIYRDGGRESFRSYKSYKTPKQ